MGYLPRFEKEQAMELTRHCESYLDPSIVREDVKLAISKAQAKAREVFDPHRRLNVEYRLGDIVYVSVNPVATGNSTKLQPRYRRPDVIVRVIPGDTYKIRSLVKRREQTHSVTAHVSKLEMLAHLCFFQEKRPCLRSSNTST